MEQHHFLNNLFFPVHNFIWLQKSVGHSCLGLPLGPLLYSTGLRIYLFTGINDCLCHYESLYSLRSATSLAMFFPLRIPLAIYGLLCLFMDFMIFSSFVKSFEFWMNLIESVDYFWSKAISTLLILLTQQKGMSFYHLFCILFSVSQSVLLYRSFMSLDRVIFEYFLKKHYWYVVFH